MNALVDRTTFTEATDLLDVVRLVTNLGPRTLTRYRRHGFRPRVRVDRVVSIGWIQP